MKTLTRKIWIWVLTAICAMCCICLVGTTFSKNVAKADTATVVCQGIANDVNNNILETVAQGNPEPRYRTLLAYNTALGTASNGTNVVSTTGEGIKLNGVKLSDIANTSVDYAHGGRYIQIKIPQAYQDALVGDIVLEVVEGTAFENHILDGAKFALKNDKWSKVSDVTYTGITWNEAGYGAFEGKKGVLLNFSANLSKVQNEIDGNIASTNFASTVGEHIYLNGVKLSTLPGAVVGYYALNFMYVYADNMSSYRTLTIEDGTVMLDAVLPEVNLYYSSASKWSTTAPTSFTEVTFNKIQWNNTGYNAFAGKKGLLLNFSANLSTIANEVNGNIGSVNFAKTSIGEKIKLGGTALKNIESAEIIYHSQGMLWIYAPNMTTLGNLTIEKANFLDATLPDLEFTFNGSSWEAYVGPQAVEFTGVTWNGTDHEFYGGKAGVLLSFSANLSTDATEVNGGIQSTNFASTVGESIYLGGVKLSSLPGAFVSYFSQNYMFVYADNMAAYRTLTIEADAVMLDSILPEVNLYYNASTKWATTESTSFTAVTLNRIQWNNTGFNAFAGKNGVLLDFSANLSAIQTEIDAGIQSINFAKTSIGEKIKLGGTALKNIEGAEINYHSQGKLWIYAPNMTTLGNLTIETTNFLDATLPDLELTFNGSAWEVYVASAVCQGIANNENNNVVEGDTYRTLLKYDATLGDAANTTNVVSTTGEGIKLNGVKLSEISGVSIDYAHGGAYVRIRIPQSYQDALTGTVILEVVEGTAFENYKLGAAKFTLRAGRWVTYVAPQAVEFTGITWNEAGYNAFEGKKGVLLAFSANLSKVQNEIDGNIASTNFASTVGEHIYLNGVKLSTLPGAVVGYYALNFMYVYADNMSSYRTLTIEDGTVMLDAVLPEVNLYYSSASKWSTTAPTSFTEVTFNKIQWNNTGYNAFAGKNGVLLAFSANLSTIQNEIDSNIASVNFAKTSIGEKIKLGGTALKDIEGAEICYYMQGMLWIYAPNMTTLGNLTIETTNFLDATLPDLEFTFKGSAWEVYVAPTGPTVVCQGIKYNEHNNVSSGNIYMTLLAYDIALGSAGNSTNVVATTGEGILLNGVKLSEIDGASVDYAYGGVYLQIKIPQSYQDALTGTVILEVVEGTAFENQILDGLKFALKDGKWKKVTDVTFTEIAWNDEGYLAYEGMQGVLLGFSANLSKLQSEIDGGIQSTNFASTVGEYIYLDGVKLSTLPGAFVGYYALNFMFVYVDCMSTYRTLTIEADTLMMDSLLPEINLYFNSASKWGETDTTNYTSVSFTGVTWNNIGYDIFAGKGGALVSFSANLSNLQRECEAGSKAVNLAKTSIGEKITLNGVALKDIDGAEINYFMQGHLWIYAPNMTFASGKLPIIEIEEDAKLLDVYLPALTLYFYDGAWTNVAPEILTIDYTEGDISIKQYIEGSITIDSDYLTNVLSVQYANVIVLGWTMGETAYFYGDSVEVSATATVSITEVIDFYTLYGASIRIASDGVTGLRFGSRVGLESYNALFENYSNVELGTYIAPKALLDAYLLGNDGTTFKDYFAQEQGSGNASKYVKVVNDGIYNRDTYEADGYVAFYGSLANIHEVNFYTKFVGVGYIKFEKEGSTYVIFGATNLADTTRTVYDIAVDAYNDTKENYSTDALKAIKTYIDPVVDLTYKGGNLNVNEVITERAYTSPYQTSYNNGVFYIAKFGSENAPKIILINGKKVSADNFTMTPGEGSLVMSISASDLATLFEDGVVYGVGEPDSALWNNGNTVATAEMLSGVTGAMNATAFRVWLSDNVTVGSSNEVSLNPEKLTEMFALVDGLAKNGVKEVYIIGQTLPLKTYANYCVEGIGWVTSNEYYTQYNGRQFYMDYHCVPDPATEGAAYAEWLELQYNYYMLLTAQIAEWQATNLAWQDVKFYFEGLNEPESQLVIHKRGSYDFSTKTNNYGYFTSNELARVLTDVSYYMTLAVNTNISQSGYVTSPALMYLTQDSGNVPVSGISTDGFMASMATVINDAVAPTAIAGVTPANTTNPEDYFTVLNWHPYLAWTKTEHGALYYADIQSTWYGTKKAVVNSDYATDWVNWNNNLYNIFVSNFTGYAPKVVFTEIGMIDYGTHVSSYTDYKTIGVTESLAATVFGNLMSAVDGLAFSNNCTIIAFRLCDLEGVYKAEQATAGYADIYVHGEGNLGLIEEDGTIKAIMKEYYYVINGTRDTTALQTEVNKYYD